MNKLVRKIAGFIAAAAIAVCSAVIPSSAEEFKRQTLPKNDAMTIVDKMGAGWNLGNTFDAANCGWLQNKLDYETGWQGDKTTKTLISGLRKAGFRSVRICVTWHEHTDDKYNIDKEWLDRIQEVTDWCMDEGLYVVMNVHHDVDKKYYYPDSAHYANSKKYLTSVWKQLADRFKNYDEKLMFEIINEPRLTGTRYEWEFAADDPPEEIKDCFDCINKLNQDSLDVIRKAGGSNKQRYVLIGTYALKNDKMGILSDMFRFPEDSAKNRIIADVHYYGVGKIDSKKRIDNLYDAFCKKGIPVVISEYGLNTNGYKLYDNTDTAAQLMGDYYAYARSRGMTVMAWDTNYGSKGIAGFKLMDRKTGEPTLPTIVSAIVKGGAPALRTRTINGIKASSSASRIKLSWDAYEGASKYAVYQYIDGKYKPLSSKIKKTSYTISKLSADTSYKFMIRAYVNGKWTDYTSADIFTVKTKAK